MHRIDTAGNIANLFDDGDPLVPRQATIVDAAWLNDVQENVAKAVENAGITLVKGTYTQLDAAILARIAAALAAPTISSPALDSGANVTGRPKLSVWKDLSGAAHVEGEVGLTGIGSQTVTVWNAGKIPAGSRPSGTMVFAGTGTTVGAARALLHVTVGSDGSLVIGSTDGTDINGGCWVSCVFHPSVPAAP